MKQSRTTCWWCDGELIWQNDYCKADIYGNDNLDGIMTFLICKDCGAIITYETPDKDDV